ncbi:MAG: tetratricopeptide repeat protein [Kofleriaceae bacterium]
MRGFRLVAPIAALLLFSGLAHADPKGDVNAKIKAAMEAYDSFDYDGAKKQLTAAVAQAKKSKLDKDPVTAKAYLDLGIVAFAVPDAEAAKAAFVDAVKIDPKIQIDVAYRSPELAKLLDSARSEAGSSGASEPMLGGGDNNSADCASVKGLDHTIIDTAKAGAPQPIEAMLGSDVKAAKVSVMYRDAGAIDFTEVKLTKQGDCKYVGAIPASAMKGTLVHYYVAAYNDAAKPVASKGSSGSPNIIEISGVAAKRTAGDDEDPIGGTKHPAGGGSGGTEEISSNVTVAPKGPQKVFLGVTAGTGFGYVTGTTEGMNTVKNCCIGKDLLVVTAELGYYVNPKLSIGLAFRMGLPVDANLAGHATGAPAGLVRVRYALSPSGEGLRVMGQLGVGYLRNTIKLDTTMPTGGDTDIVAQGPLLLGGGIGYMKRLGSAVAFIADVNATAGIAVVKTVGISPMNSGVSADANIGFAVGF